MMNSSNPLSRQPDNPKQSSGLTVGSSPKLSKHRHQLGTLILLVVILVAVAGFLAYRHHSKSNNTSSAYASLGAYVLKGSKTGTGISVQLPTKFLAGGNASQPTVSNRHFFVETITTNGKKSIAGYAYVSSISTTPVSSLHTTLFNGY